MYTLEGECENELGITLEGLMLLKLLQRGPVPVRGCSSMAYPAALAAKPAATPSTMCGAWWLGRGRSSGFHGCPQHGQRLMTARQALPGISKDAAQLVKMHIPLPLSELHGVRLYHTAGDEARRGSGMEQKDPGAKRACKATLPSGLRPVCPA